MSVDCRNDSEHMRSVRHLKNDNVTIEDVLLQWISFYRGRGCVPTYYDNFLGAGDNSTASKSTADYFVALTRKGIIATNYQDDDEKHEQRGWIAGFMPKFFLEHRNPITEMNKKSTKVSIVRSKRAFYTLCWICNS